MKKLLLLIFGILVALPALTQVRPSSVVQPYDQIQAERKFGLIEIFDNDAYIDSFKILKLKTIVKIVGDGSITKQQLPPDSAILYLADDGVSQYIGTTTWRKNAVFDTTYTETARIDDPATSNRWTVVNILTATNSAKPGVFNKSFSFVNASSAVSSASITVTCDRVEFFGERWQGHGNVKVFIDGQQVQTLSQGSAPYVTDFSRLQPSFYYIFPKATPSSPPTAHTLKLETDPSNQYIIDMVRTLNYTLTVRK